MSASATSRKGKTLCQVGYSLRDCQRIHESLVTYLPGYDQNVNRQKMLFNTRITVKLVSMLGANTLQILVNIVCILRVDSQIRLPGLSYDRAMMPTATFTTIYTLRKTRVSRSVCVISSETFQYFRWYYNNEDVQTLRHLEGRYKILADGSLIIYTVVSSDKGNFTCVPDNGIRPLPNATASLTVLCKWEIIQ